MTNRTNRTAPESTGHLDRLNYGSPSMAVADARRVIADLLVEIQEPDHLFPDPARLEFLARRAADLTDAARRACEREGL